jgi:chromosome segregation ATPase
MLQQTKADFERGIGVLKTQSMTHFQQKQDMENGSKTLEQKISDLKAEIQNTQSKDAKALAQKSDEIKEVTAKLEAFRREIELAMNNHQEEQQRLDDQIQPPEERAQTEQKQVGMLVD